MVGSKAEIPKDLLEQIRQLEKDFTVPIEKLKQITDHFVSELTKGLSVEGGSIVSPASSPCPLCFMLTN
jgi:hexokinase